METNTTLNKKVIHEMFVHSGKGTTLSENYLVITLPILLHILYSFKIITLYQIIGIDLKGQLLPNLFAVVLPFVLILTSFNHYISEIYVTIVVIVIICGLTSLILSIGTKYRPNFRLSYHLIDDSGRIGLLCISRLKGLILISTAFAILAVDLPIFPRRFAKTHKIGFSPMDLGVGMFTMISGVVGGTKFSNSLILLTLGMIRTIVIKFLNYPEVEAEYGKHWNFFITLAIVRVIGLCLKRLGVMKNVLLCSSVVVLLSGFQVLIFKNFGWEDWALNDNITTKENVITNFFIDNRQGLVSLLGFVILWLVGSIVQIILNKGSRRNHWLSVIVLLSILCPILVNMDCVTVSRTSANLGYIVWCSGTMFWVLLLFLVADVCLNWLEDRSNYVTDNHWPDLLTIANKYSLLYFLLVNILTGLTNLAFDTHNLPTMHSLAVLMSYLCIPLLMFFIYNHCPLKKCCRKFCKTNKYN